MTICPSDTPEPLRPFLSAAYDMGLPIGHMTPERALNYIVNTGQSMAVSQRARELFPDQFTR